MKFGRLLASGKSLVNGNVAGRYQMRQGLVLPQFISPKNPFKQEAAAKPVAPSPAAAAPATVMLSEPIASPFREGNGGARVRKAATSLAVQKEPRGTNPTSRSRKAMGLLTVAATKTRAAAKWSGEALRRAALFCLDHNPFSAIGRPKLAGIPRFGKPAEQPELSLDRVRVVRNDLTHADLEVVRAGGGVK